MIKDYDLNINYHPGTAIMVADALSRKAYCSSLMSRQSKVLADLTSLGVEIVLQGFLHELRLQPLLIEEIKSAQRRDQEIQLILKKMRKGKAPGSRVDQQGALWFEDRICVSRVPELRDAILREAHDSRFSIHPGCTKMFEDLRTRFWWVGMKADIAEYVALCDVCRRVKAEQQRPAGLLKPMSIRS